MIFMDTSGIYGFPLIHASPTAPRRLKQVGARFTGPISWLL